MYKGWKPFFRFPIDSAQAITSAAVIELVPGGDGTIGICPGFIEAFDQACRNYGIGCCIGLLGETEGG